MKISPLVVTKLALLVASASINTSQAFQPNLLSTSTSTRIAHEHTGINADAPGINTICAQTINPFISKRSFQLHESKPSNTQQETSTTNNNELSLSYPPISLFGKSTTPTISKKTVDNPKHYLGGKGANLAEMSQIGLAVPPGFTITTECCAKFCSTEKEEGWDASLPDELWTQILDSVTTIEQSMNCQFGNPQNPLLLSVRSGAAISMPGMMDTVLNLGMNSQVVQGLAQKTDNARFAWDSYRRFLEMFGNVVLGIPRHLFEDCMDDVKYSVGVFEDSELTVEHLQQLVVEFEGVYQTMGLTFPQDPQEQLRLAIGAVFKGWMGRLYIFEYMHNAILNIMCTNMHVYFRFFTQLLYDLYSLLYVCRRKGCEISSS